MTTSIVPSTRATAELGVSILIVDDIPRNLLALEAILGSLGHELVRANSGEEALRELALRDFAAVLLDVRMPNMDGYEVAAAVRAGQRNQHVPILFLTADDRTDEVERAFALGAADYLQKPLNPTFLRGKVAMFVELFRKETRIQELLDNANQRASQAEAEAERLRLHAEHDLLRAVVDDSGDGILVADQEGIVRTVNAAAAHQRGVPIDVGVGARALPLALLSLDGEPLPFEATPLSHALGGTRVEGERFKVRRPDGSIRILSGTASPLRRQDGTPLGAVMTTRDETDRLLAEDQLRERNRLLALNLEVGIALGGDATLHEVLQSCTQAFVRHIDAALARIWTLSDSGGILELQASAGTSTTAEGAHRRVPVGEFEIGQIAKERAPYLTNQVVGDARVSDQEWAVREKMTAFAGYPLLIGDRVIGVVAVFARHSLSPTVLSAMEAIVGDVAQGIERRKAEERLRVNETWLSTTLTSIGDGVIATDARGAVAYLNPVASTLTGWATEEARGRSLDEVFRIIHEKTRAVVASPVAMVLQKGGVVALANHTLLLRRDGSEVPIEDSAAPIRDPQGQLMGVVLVFRDGSEQRRAEAERARMLDEAQRAHQEAEAARRRLHSLFMQAPAAICILAGPKHRFELANSLYLRLIGKSNVVGQTVAEALPEVVEQGFIKLLDSVYATGRPFLGKELPLMVDVEGAGPSLSVLNFVYEPFRDLDGNVAGILVIAIDVTETVDAREKIDEARKRAEHSEQEQRVAREEADRLRAQAEQANDAKDQFFATISHELRTPLTSILGWARIVRTRPEKLEKGLETIERNAKVQAQLIDDMLDSARIAAGKLSINPASFFVSDAIDAAVDTARPVAATKGLALETDVDPDVGTIIADAQRFQQVVSNLLSNAMKFTARDGLIRVVARRMHSMLEVVVEDSGKGISADLLPHVFERFRQADPGSAGGLGLGLAIVRSIVEMHGGNVSVESDGPGKGARFCVRFPIQAARRPEGPTADSGDDGMARILAGAFVLVVDDEPDAREVIATILGQAGARVETASSVDEALATFEATRPDAVVSDIGMPGKDGYVFIHELRTSPRYKAEWTPVIALTAFARGEDRRKALMAGFTSYISKPVEPNELAIVVANALRRDVRTL